ncbi:MAG: tyrosine recombinase XerD [Saprospiraceae bacterium]|nr:tyrosine recombinase XerD [Saprospiraceae bacterium]|tara:strand:+ start:673 stop:1596 length:924 start_codon:yes stop_codon:yes gene_type:complete
MDWNSGIKGFKAFLQLEKSLSPNTVVAYERDILRLYQFAEEQLSAKSPLDISYDDLEEYLAWLSDFSLADYSRARMLSGIKAFFKYLLIEDLILDDPSELLEGPKLRRKIPDVLSYEEVEKMLAAIDLSHPQGHRNRSILETIYACGLRVSELTHLRLSNYYPDIEIVKVVGKGNKERIIPIGDSAIKHINFYLEGSRRHMTNIDKAHTDYIYLNRRGKKLSRVMVFNIIKKAVSDSGIQKNVSPHTLRHSFATHLIERGADLKAVQDMLGHESIITTEIYTHLDTEFLRKTVMSYHPAYIRKSVQN